MWMQQRVEVWLVSPLKILSFSVFCLWCWNATCLQPCICELNFGKTGLHWLSIKCDCFLFLIIYRFIKCFFFRGLLICNHKHKKPAAFYFLKKYNSFNTEFCPLFSINSNKTSGNIYCDYFSLALALLFY